MKFPYKYLKLLNEILVFCFSYWIIAFKELVKAEYFKLVFYNLIYHLIYSVCKVHKVILVYQVVFYTSEIG